MKVFNVVYCFCDKNGLIESGENGDFIFSEIVTANNNEEAVEKLKEKENFIQEPDILDVKEVYPCK